MGRSRVGGHVRVPDWRELGDRGDAVLPLPSWISYLVDQDKARPAGRELFNAVYDRWSKLPADRRPRLYVFGESLGSFGAETAFSGERQDPRKGSG